MRALLIKDAWENQKYHGIQTQMSERALEMRKQESLF
jgi:hypothetical protein